MSKQVRLSDDLAARVGGVAELERRSFANMVEVLLLAALAGRGPVVPKRPAVSTAWEASGSVQAAVHDVQMHTKARDLAIKDGKCSADVAYGTKCKLCGKVH